MKMHRKVISTALATIMTVGTLSSIGFAAAPTVIVNTTDGANTIDELRPIAVWSYDNEGKTYRDEQGNEVSLVSGDVYEYTGKTRKPKSQKARVEKSIPIKNIEEFYEQQVKRAVDKDKLSMKFSAADGFGFLGKYYNLVNKDPKNPNLIYIKNFGRDIFKDGKVDASLGTPVDGVLSIITDGTDIDKDFDPVNMTDNKSMRLYTGTNTAAKDFNDDMLANFGFMSVQNISDISMREAYNVADGVKKVVRTSDGTYMETSGGGVIKLFGDKTLVAPGEEVKLQPMSENIKGLKVYNRAVGSSNEPLVSEPDENGVYKFTMPEGDIQLSIDEKNIRIPYREGEPDGEHYDPYDTIRLSLPKYEDGKAVYSVDLVGLNTGYNNGYPMNDFKNGPEDVTEFGGIIGLQYEVSYPKDQVDFQKSSIESELISASKWDPTRFLTIGISTVYDEKTQKIKNVQQVPGTLMYFKMKLKDGIKEIDNSKVVPINVGVDRERNKSDDPTTMHQKITTDVQKALKEVDVKYNTEYRKNDQLPAGTLKTVQEGKDGKGLLVESEIYYSTYATAGTKKKKIEVTSAPTNRIIEVGTKAPEFKKLSESTDIKKKDDAAVVVSVDNEAKTINVIKIKADGTKVKSIKDVIADIVAADGSRQRRSGITKDEKPYVKIISQDDKHTAEYEIVFVDRPQEAPTGLTVKNVKSENDKTGEIMGVTSAMEYRKVGDNDWTKITGDKVENLGFGEYEVRYAAKEGYSASEPVKVSIVIQLTPQEAPKGLKGSKVKNAEDKTGVITGVSPEMEYRKVGDDEWIKVTGDKIENLGLEKYEVRYAAKEGYAASPAVTVQISKKSSGGTGGNEPSKPVDDKDKDKETDKVENLAPYVEGYPGDIVKPDGDITRAEAAAMLARILTKDAKLEAGENSYSDVPEEAWYRAVVDYVTKEGYMQGYADKSFKPDESITRAEFSEMIKRINKDEIKDGVEFTDVAEGHWAYPAINLASKRGIVEGYEDGSFRPEKNITRAEAITIMNRLFDNKVTEDEASKIEAEVSPYKDLNKDHWVFIDIVLATLGIKK